MSAFDEEPSIDSRQIEDLEDHYPSILHAAAHRLDALQAVIRDVANDLTYAERELLSAETIKPDDYERLPRFLAAATIVTAEAPTSGYALWELTSLGCELRWHLMAEAERGENRD